MVLKLGHNSESSGDLVKKYRLLVPSTQPQSSGVEPKNVHFTQVSRQTLVLAIMRTNEIKDVCPPSAFLEEYILSELLYPKEQCLKRSLAFRHTYVQLDQTTMTQMKAKSSSTLLSKAKVSGTHLAPTFSPILEPHFKHTSKTFHCSSQVPTLTSFP